MVSYNEGGTDGERQSRCRGGSDGDGDGDACGDETCASGKREVSDGRTRGSPFDDPMTAGRGGAREKARRRRRRRTGGRKTRTLTRMRTQRSNRSAGSVSETREWRLETDGTSLLNILSLPFVDATRTHSNFVNEVVDVLGIEAGVQILHEEIRNVIEFDGTYVNPRHFAVVVDTMAYRGKILAMSRHGINRLGLGFLVRCSFEETVDILFQAAAFAETNPIQDGAVTEAIITGQPAPLGTGVIDVLLDGDYATRWECQEAQTSGGVFDLRHSGYRPSPSSSSSSTSSYASCPSSAHNAPFRGPTASSSSGYPPDASTLASASGSSLFPSTHSSLTQTPWQPACGGVVRTGSTFVGLGGGRSAFSGATEGAGDECDYDLRRSLKEDEEAMAAMFFEERGDDESDRDGDDDHDYDHGAADDPFSDNDWGGPRANPAGNGKRGGSGGSIPWDRPGGTGWDDDRDHDGWDCCVDEEGLSAVRPWECGDGGELSCAAPLPTRHAARPERGSKRGLEEDGGVGRREGVGRSVVEFGPSPAKRARVVGTGGSV